MLGKGAIKKGSDSSMINHLSDLLLTFQGSCFDCSHTTEHYIVLERFLGMLKMSGEDSIVAQLVNSFA